jgi:hypothetical protein
MNLPAWFTLHSDFLILASDFFRRGNREGGGKISGEHAERATVDRYPGPHPIQIRFFPKTAHR